MLLTIDSLLTSPRTHQQPSTCVNTSATILIVDTSSRQQKISDNFNCTHKQPPTKRSARLLLIEEVKIGVSWPRRCRPENMGPHREQHHIRRARDYRDTLPVQHILDFICQRFLDDAVVGLQENHVGLGGSWEDRPDKFSARGSQEEVAMQQHGGDQRTTIGRPGHMIWQWPLLCKALALTGKSEFLLPAWVVSVACREGAGWPVVAGICRVSHWRWAFNPKN